LRLSGNIADPRFRNDVANESITSRGIFNGSAQATEVAATPSGEGHIRRQQAAGRFPRTFIIAEEEQLVLPDRAAQAAAEAVVHAERLRRGEKVARVKPVAIVVVECCAVVFVGA